MSLSFTHSSKGEPEGKTVCPDMIAGTRNKRKMSFFIVKSFYENLALKCIDCSLLIPRLMNPGSPLTGENVPR
jgi:hypothetical protein